MIDPFSVRMTGALVAHREGLWAALAALGYSPLSAMNLLRVAAHLSRWLEQQHLALEVLTHAHVAAFLEVRRRRYTQFRTARALAPILGYLEQAGAITLGSPATPHTAVDQVVARFERYLLRERGLTLASVRAYAAVARRFLSRLPALADEGAIELHAGDVTSFVLADASHYSVGTTKYVVTALRSFLRFLHLEGRLGVDLCGALPAIAGWRLSALPKALDPNEVRALLRSCDRRRHVGRRDYAVLLLLVRLGLRRIEVARLELDDIDWRAGELLVRGKGCRHERLPLPDDVGEALVSYLRHSRPPRPIRAAFLSARAPYGALSSAAIGAIATAAFKRCGWSGVNPHRLRHTAATQMLRAGASLDEIAQVLRHRSHDTTAIYAKVDRLALAHVVRPWPGGGA